MNHSEVLTEVPMFHPGQAVKVCKMTQRGPSHRRFEKTPFTVVGSTYARTEFVVTLRNTTTGETQDVRQRFVRAA